MKKTVVLLLILLGVSLVLFGCKKDSENEKDTGVNADEYEEQNEDKEDEKDIPSEDTQVKNIDYVLYLKHSSLPFLYGEKFSIKSNDDALIEKGIEVIALEKLINYDHPEGFVSPIPKGTKINSLEKKDKILYLDLSEEFVNNMKDDSESTKLAIDSIVNTLTFLPDNEAIILTIEGEEVKMLNGVDISKEFSFSSDFIPDK